MDNSQVATLLQEAVDFHNASDLVNAESFYVKVISLDENNAVAYYNLGLIYREKGDDENAELFFTKTAELNPKYVESFIQLGELYIQHKLNDLAITQFQKALDLDTSRMSIYENLAPLYFHKNEFEKALKLYNKLLIFSPNNVMLLNNVGSCYQQLNETQLAKQYYEKALSIKPEDISTLYNLSYIYLIEKDYIIGFDLYRNRYNREIRGDKEGGVAYPPTLLAPIDNIDNKKVYISHEQGIGDTISFARFFPLFLEKNAKIISYVPPSLTKLFSYNYPNIEFIEANSNISFDYNFPIMEAPYILGMSYEEIPYQDGFLQVKKEDILSFKAKHNFSSKRKIGINYRGAQTATSIKDRGIDLELLLKELSLLDDDIEIYSLQYETTKQDLDLFSQYNVINLGKEINDFYDTAVMIEAMDLMVSIDTSVLNLCGALGKESIGLLNYVNLWRWVKDSNSKVSWYNSIQTIQQHSLKNWDNVVHELNDEIEKKLCHLA